MSRYFAYIAAGRCGQCSRKRERLDSKICDTCTERRNAQNRARYYRLRSERSCGQCGVPSSQARCSGCKEDRKSKYAHRRESGVCGKCGKEPSDRFAHCLSCRKKHQAALSSQYQIRKANGICTRCGIAEAMHSLTHCLWCREDRRAKALQARLQQVS